MEEDKHGSLADHTGMLGAYGLYTHTYTAIERFILVRFDPNTCMFPFSLQWVKPPALHVQSGPRAFSGSLVYVSL